MTTNDFQQADGFDLRDPAFIDDPYPAYAKLRERGPVLWSERHRSWVVTTYEAALAFLAESRLSADRTAAEKFGRPREPRPERTLGSEPPEHTTVRGLLNNGLNPSAAAIAGQIPAMVDELLDRLTAGCGRVPRSRRYWRRHWQ